MLLQDVLGIKQRIEVMPENDKQHYVSSVQDIANGKLFIDIPYMSGRPISIRKGTKVYITFNKKDAFYRLVTQIENYHDDNIGCYELLLPEKVDRIQRRDFYRLKVLIDACYDIVTPESTNFAKNSSPENMKSGKIIDISGSGARLLAMEEVKMGNKLLVKFYISEVGSLLLLCEIKRIDKVVIESKEAYYVGLKFININRRTQDTLIKYILNKHAAQRSLR